MEKEKKLMLFSLLVMITQAIICFLAFSLGLNIGKGDKPISLSTQIKNIVKTKSKVSKEEQRFRDILDNIEQYDGTSNGQKEIK